MKTKTCDQIRWLIRRDMEEVLAIEKRSFPDPWTEDEFMKCLRQPNGIGVSAVINYEIIGYMIYELHETHIRLLNFAVAPLHRRCGVGRDMVERIIDKLSQQRRTHVMLEIRESNLAAQLFFARCGFIAVGVEKNFCGTGEDAYQFRYCLPGVFVEQNQ